MGIVKDLPGLLMPLLVIPISIGIANCAGGYDSASRLRTAVYLLNHDVRWQDWDGAEALCTAAARRALAERRRQWGTDVHVADFDISRTVLNRDKTEARVTVVVSWYRMSDSILRRTVLEQRWEQRRRDWLLASEQSRSGERM